MKENIRNPKVSIIIANYNYARYLEQRLDSIIQQTYRDFEIIFLDDASSDESVELCKNKYKHYITHFKVNSVNTGNPFVQWNKGVRLAQGKYIWIAEADDFCEPTFLEEMVPLLESNPNVGLGYCQSLRVDSQGNALDDWTWVDYTHDLDPQRWRSNFTNTGIDEIKTYLVIRNTIPNASAVLFRKSAYVQAGYAVENLKFAGDWLTYCKVLEQSDIIFNKHILNYNRWHFSRVTANSFTNLVSFREVLYVQQYLFKRYQFAELVKSRAFQRFIDDWRYFADSSYGRITVLNNIKLAFLAMRYYPQKAHIIVKELSKVLSKFVPASKR